MDLNLPDEGEEILGDESDESVAVERFGFLQEDRVVIQELIAGIRRALRRRSITPQQTCCLGKLLHCLERMPRSTDCSLIEVSIGRETAEYSFYQSIELTDSSLELWSGGSRYSSVGSDSYTDFRFLVETGGFRQNIEVSDIEDWVYSFVESVCDEDQDLRVHDEDAGSVPDWDDQTPEDDWDQLDSKY